MSNWYPLRCKNDAGETIPAWSAVRISGAEHNANEPMTVKVKKPDGHITDGLFVNGPKDIASTEYGTLRPTTGGSPFWVKYNGTAPSAGDEVGPQSGVYTFNKLVGGFIVLEVDTTNTILCAVQHSVIVKFVKLDGALSAASNVLSGAASATASVYEGSGTSGGTWADSGDNITVYNRDTTNSYSSGDYGIALRILNEWLFSPTEC